MEIPKTIWQTYKDEYEALPKYIKDTAESWKKHNPEYEYVYMSDSQAADFILEKFGTEYYEIFKSLPVGVMRGDMWRYLIIYEYGGIYTDLDTVCNKPIDSWLEDGYEFIVCPENEVHLCQWTFAATPKSPILKSVIDLMISRLKSPQFDIPHAVHIHTGPAVWTEGILKEIGVISEDEVSNYELTNGKTLNLLFDYEKINNLEKSKQHKLLIYGGKNARIFHEDAVKHLYGSQTWNEGYVQWIKHVK